MTEEMRKAVEQDPDQLFHHDHKEGE
jgi:hypothetical protein